MTKPALNGPAPAATPIADAHARLRADPSIQFDFPWFIEPERAPPPDWLLALGRFIARIVEWLGPLWQVLLWGMVALIVVGIVVAVTPALRERAIAWWERRRSRRIAPDEPARWAPAEHAARALLEEADRLAALGRYDEAVHLILYRSIEDIEAWRGDIVRPSLTSRDIAALDSLPDRARSVFARIVAAVERSLFARLPLGADDWQRTRADYAGFALGA